MRFELLNCMSSLNKQTLKTNFVFFRKKKKLYEKNCRKFIPRAFTLLFFITHMFLTVKNHLNLNNNISK